MFEFYGHGGVGFLVNVLTDNDNRAFKDISFVAKGLNIKQAAANSVAFKFDTKARLNMQSVIDEVSVSGNYSLSHQIPLIVNLLETMDYAVLLDRQRFSQSSFSANRCRLIEAE